MLYPDLTLSYIDCLSLRERISHQPESIIARPTRRLTVPRGAVVKRALHADPELLYFLYWPKRAQVDAPILVTVHGISRNAFEQMTAFAELAERHGIVLGPLFTHTASATTRDLVDAAGAPIAPWTVSSPKSDISRPPIRRGFVSSGIQVARNLSTVTPWPIPTG